MSFRKLLFSLDLNVRQLICKCFILRKSVPSYYRCVWVFLW